MNSIIGTIDRTTLRVFPVNLWVNNSDQLLTVSPVFYAIADETSSLSLSYYFLIEYTVCKEMKVSRSVVF